MKRLRVGVAMALAVQVAALPAAAAPSLCDAGPAKFDVAKVMEAARSPKPGLVLLSAHRGYWRDPTVPENSIEAVRRAVAANIETIEIDVRLDNSGHAWMLHDFAMDRLTDGYGYLSGNNTQTLQRQVKLRNRHGEVTDLAMSDLDDALNYLGQTLVRDKGHVRGFVLVIDLKSPQGKDPNAAKVSAYKALQASWARVQEVSKKYQYLWPDDTGPVLGRAVVFKLKAKEIPVDPRVLEKDLGLTPANWANFNFEPVMHNDDAQHADPILKAYFNKPYAVGFEPSAEFVGQSNTTRWIQALKNAGRTVTGFASWYDYPEGVAYSWGECCLSRDIDPGSGGKLDYSADWDFALQIGSNWIVADTAPFLHDYLAPARRDLSKIC